MNEPDANVLLEVLSKLSKVPNMFESCLFRMRSIIEQSSNGHIELIIGPMFSGKSTELMRRVTRYQIGGKRCLLIKYSKVSFDLTFVV